ncbi:MAG: DUF502 domain-containing protein [Chloroflexi bacterium]|nr:DUF502 domain-containing protein [Chloroflexota bacterium]
MTKGKPNPAWRAFLLHLRNTLTAGLLLLVPLLITYWILDLAFRGLDGVFAPIVEQIFGWQVPGVGIVLLVALVYVAGVLAENVVGRSLIHAGQSTLLRVPLISTIYDTSKQLIESFSGSTRTGFKRVVVIEYPRSGSWAVGFLTGMTRNEMGQSLGVVYIPSAPMPNTGWVAILPVEDIYDTDLSVPMAMRLTLSGGTVSPAEFKKSPLELAPSVGAGPTATK